MKKVVLTAMGLLLAMAVLAGCGDAATSGAAASSSAASSSSMAASSSSEADSSSSVPASSSTPEAATIYRGVWEDDTYVNESCGYSFTLPEGWSAGTDEEFASVMGMSVDMLADAGMNVTDDAVANGMVYDMFAYNATTGSSVNSLLEYLGKVPGGILMSPEMYIEASQKQMESLENMNFEFGEITTQTIGDKEYTVVDMQASYDGNTMEQHMLVRKVDAYMLVMTISINPGDTFENVLAGLA